MAGPTAYPGTYEGARAYPKAFPGTGYGVVLEDDGQAGYLYVTNESADQVLDALYVFRSGTPPCPGVGETFYFVFEPSTPKVGLYIGEAFHAVVDFRRRRACCRSAFPPATPGGWCTSSHAWDESMVAGLEP